MDYIKEVLHGFFDENRGIELQLLSFLIEIRKKNKESRDELQKLITQSIDLNEKHADKYEKLKTTSKPSVYIGYHWAQKDFCLKIYNELSNHFNCYTYDKTGLYSVDKGILNDATVFICCLTSEYTNSIDNLDELRFAFDNNKYIIPVLLTLSCWQSTNYFNKFIPGQFFIDFASQHKYKTNLPKLIKFIENVLL